MQMREGEEYYYHCYRKEKEEDQLDPTTHRLRHLHLSSYPSDHHHHPIEEEVIFSDPCSVCGTMKRRISHSPKLPHHQHHQDPIFINNNNDDDDDPTTPLISSSPRNHKKLKKTLLPFSSSSSLVFLPEEDKHNSSPPPPFPSSSVFQPSFFPISLNSDFIITSPSSPPPPPVEAEPTIQSNSHHQPNYPFPPTSTSISKPITTPSPVKSLFTPPPETNSSPLSTTTPNSSQALKQSTSLSLKKPVPVVVVSYLNKYPSFPGYSCNRYHQDSTLPPDADGFPCQPHLLRSFSDPNFHSSSSFLTTKNDTPTIAAPTTTTTTTTKLVISDDITPILTTSSAPSNSKPNVAKKRWKKLKDKIMEITQKLNELIDEHNQHHSDEEEEEDKVDDNAEKKETNIQKQITTPLSKEEEEERVISNSNTTGISQQMEVEEVVMEEEKVKYEGDGESMIVQYTCSCCGIPYKVQLDMKNS